MCEWARPFCFCFGGGWGRRKKEKRRAELTLSFSFRLSLSWLALGKVSRVPIGSFKAGLALAGVDVEAEEVECMVANMIYKVRSNPSFTFLSSLSFRSFETD